MNCLVDNIADYLKIRFTKYSFHWRDEQLDPTRDLGKSKIQYKTGGLDLAFFWFDPFITLAQ